VGSIKDVLLMGVFFVRETDRVANVGFAEPRIFQVVEELLAGRRYAQGMNRWGGYGGKLHGPMKLDLLCKGVIS